MSIACALCGSPGSTPWLRKVEWQYRHCSSCSAVWLDPLPAEDWAENFYDGAYFEGGGRGGYRDYLADAEQHAANARTRVELARQFGAAPPGLWIDVGCAAGFTLREARDQGFTARGVDPSPWARRAAHERFGFDLFPSLDQARRDLEGRASVLTMFQVLEHLPDPQLALRQARACLRPGGLLLIETWDRASRVARLFGRHWQQITPPSVIWLFDGRSLEKVLANSGFSLRAVLPTSKSVSLGWVCGLLAEKTPRLISPALSWLAASAAGRLSARYRLGDLAAVVAVAEDTGRRFPAPGAMADTGTAADRPTSRGRRQTTVRQPYPRERHATQQ